MYIHSEHGERFLTTVRKVNYQDTAALFTSVPRAIFNPAFVSVLSDSGDGHYLEAHTDF